MGLLRNRRVRLAVELSVLLHLLLAWVLPEAQAMAAMLLPVPRVKVAAAPQEDKPLAFQLVELPNQKEEKPSRRDAPGSDLSRRAHGGEGEKADKPASRGTTYDLRLAPGAASHVPPAGMTAPPPSRSAATQARQAPPQAQPESLPSTEGSPAAPDSAATVLRPEVRQPTPSKPILQGLAPLANVPPSGGAAPDRSGGQVDLGPLSFDTQWYDWGAYAAEMLRRIRYHWNIPEIAQLGVQGKVRIHFTIERDGRVSGLSILRESGHPPMDFAARDAILTASPLPPLPADLIGVDREGVTIAFYYNVRPPDERR
jgi:TonB family protein